MRWVSEMPMYTVTVEEHVGHQYVVRAASEQEAHSVVTELYSSGDEGDVTFSEVNSIDIVEGRPTGLTWDDAVTA